jgi:3-deoxy-7-phosphoheptulonate synthase
MLEEPTGQPNADEIEPLTTPQELVVRFPMGAGARATVARARRRIRDVLHGRDPDRLVVVVGPCSLHDRGAALEYARRLRAAAEATRESLVVVMRTYVEKPRTALGWTGLLNDPHLDGTDDLAAGLQMARSLLVEINRLGVPCGGEVLDPNVHPFLADTLAWASIGARTVESQTHRQLASGLRMPVGFKNGTDGDLSVAANAMLAAAAPHRVVGTTADGRSALYRTRGNPDRHLILRGGAAGPNFEARSVSRAGSLVAEQGVRRTVMVDCSHANSGRDHRHQGQVCRDVIGQIAAGDRGILGVLLESHLQAGRQVWEAGVAPRPDLSITDACIGWAETETLLHELASAAARRAPRRATPHSRKRALHA